MIQLNRLHNLLVCFIREEIDKPLSLGSRGRGIDTQRWWDLREKIDSGIPENVDSVFLLLHISPITYFSRSSDLFKNKHFIISILDLIIT